MRRWLDRELFVNSSSSSSINTSTGNIHHSIKISISHSIKIKIKCNDSINIKYSHSRNRSHSLERFASTCRHEIRTTNLTRPLRVGQRGSGASDLARDSIGAIPLAIRAIVLRSEVTGQSRELAVGLPHHCATMCALS